ncbi:MAG: hypothetical protein M3P29_10585, partial [Acidobacteriota bacterium]|nr:hypothetical protein [Acidobacteriota bacterium]
MQIKRWELNAIVIELVVLSGVAMGLAVGLLSRLSVFARVPFYVLMGVGCGFLGILQIPVLSLLGRITYQHQISPRSRIAWCVLSVFIYIAMSRLMEYLMPGWL